MHDTMDETMKMQPQQKMQPPHAAPRDFLPAAAATLLIFLLAAPVLAARVF